MCLLCADDKQTRSTTTSDHPFPIYIPIHQFYTSAQHIHTPNMMAPIAPSSKSMSSIGKSPSKRPAFMLSVADETEDMTTATSSMPSSSASSGAAGKIRRRCYSVCKLQQENNALLLNLCVCVCVHDCVPHHTRRHDGRLGQG